MFLIHTFTNLNFLLSFRLQKCVKVCSRPAITYEIPELIASYLIFIFFSYLILYLLLLLLLLLSRFSCVRLCATPQTAAHQAPPSLGFSRQEHWSGLPFPSPMDACILIHFSRVQLCATLRTAAQQASLSTGFSRQEYWSGLLFPSPFIPTTKCLCR